MPPPPPRPWLRPRATNFIHSLHRTAGPDLTGRAGPESHRFGPSRTEWHEVGRTGRIGGNRRPCGRRFDRKRSTVTQKEGLLTQFFFRSLDRSKQCVCVQTRVHIGPSPRVFLVCSCLATREGAAVQSTYRSVPGRNFLLIARSNFRSDHKNTHHTPPTKSILFQVDPQFSHNVTTVSRP